MILETAFPSLSYALRTFLASFCTRSLSSYFSSTSGLRVVSQLSTSILVNIIFAIASGSFTRSIRGESFSSRPRPTAHFMSSRIFSSICFSSLSVATPASTICCPKTFMESCFSHISSSSLVRYVPESDGLWPENLYVTMSSNTGPCLPSITLRFRRYASIIANGFNPSMRSACISCGLMPAPSRATSRYPIVSPQVCPPMP